MSANTETTGAKCKAPTWCDFDDDEDAGDSRLDVYVKAKDGIYGVVSKEGRRYCTPACRDARPSPIAAPAAHVERRKGQTWEYQFQDDEPLYHVVLTERCEPNAWATAKHGMIFDTAWSDPNVRMTLLADAPPEPAKPSQLNCAKCGRSTDVCQFACTDRGACELTDCPCLAKSPPVQEAPKAAPVCQGGCGGMGLLHKGDVLERVIKGRGRILACDGYMLFMGNDGAPIVGTGVLRDPAIGERLPRPQLAADWVEDCLGDVR